MYLIFMIQTLLEHDVEKPMYWRTGPLKTSSHAMPLIYYNMKKCTFGSVLNEGHDQLPAPLIVFICMTLLHL